MLVYIKTDFRLNDQDLDIKAGSVVDIDDKVGKKIILAEYGHAVDIIEVKSDDVQKTEDEPVSGEESKTDGINLNDLKVEELKTLAKEQGIDGYTSMKKEELIEALSE